MASHRGIVSFLPRDTTNDKKYFEFVIILYECVHVFEIPGVFGARIFKRGLCHYYSYGILYERTQPIGLFLTVGTVVAIVAIDSGIEIYKPFFGPNVPVNVFSSFVSVWNQRCVVSVETPIQPKK